MTEIDHDGDVEPDPSVRTPAARQPGRPPIPAQRFVDAALAIIDEEGLDAVTMRAVAQRLGSGTATIYRHFDNRAQLLAEVLDRVLSEASEDLASTEPDDPIDELRLVCQSTFDALHRHRRVLPLLAQQLPSGTHAAAGRDRIITALRGAGCSPELATKAYATLARYVLGFAIQLSNGTSGAAVEPAGGHGPPVPLEVEFSFGLDLLLAGLGQTMGSGSGASPSFDG